MIYNSVLKVTKSNLKVTQLLILSLQWLEIGSLFPNFLTALLN